MAAHESSRVDLKLKTMYSVTNWRGFEAGEWAGIRDKLTVILQCIQDGLATRSRRRLRLLAATGLVGCVFAGAGCRPKPPPNLLLVTVDTLRADHCSTYGYERETTPVLDGLAREGAVLGPAYAPMATTAPAHASIFTGRYPISHGVVKNSLSLASDQTTLAETLKQARFVTSGVVSSFVLKRRYGFGQGFDTYQSQFDVERETLDQHQWKGSEGYDRRADETTDLALAWLEQRQRDAPFFLWVHYFDPHSPYSPPPDFLGRFPVPEGGTDLEATLARYDEEIAFADQQLGRLLAALERQELTEQTLVVVTSDHGEGLDQHGHMGHGLHLYEEAVRVPLVMRWPGRIPPGTRLKGDVEHIDLVPTILDLMGLDGKDQQYQGRSLAPALLRGGKAILPGNRPVFLQRRLYTTRRVGQFEVLGQKFAVRYGRWKYIEALEEGSRELFDLDGDPGEVRNLAGEMPGRVQQLSGGIAAWRSQYGTDEMAVEDVSQEASDALRSLGYVR